MRWPGQSRAVGAVGRHGGSMPPPSPVPGPILVATGSAAGTGEGQVAGRVEG